MYATPSSSRRWSSAASPIASDGDLREPVAAEPRLDGRDDALDQLERDRALDARALESAQQLGAVERLTAAVALDDPQRRLLEALERREARVAVEALATPADGLARIAHARFEHARLTNAAGRADHRPTTRSSVVCPPGTPDTVPAASDGAADGSTRRRVAVSERGGASARGRARCRARRAAAAQPPPPSATTGSGTSSTCAGPRPSSRLVTGPRTPAATAGRHDARCDALRATGVAPRRGGRVERRVAVHRLRGGWRARRAGSCRRRPGRPRRASAGSTPACAG